MKPNCIIIYGITHQPCLKHAGPFRVATELRQHGYTVQCINYMSFENDVDLFFEAISHLISKNTLWLGISNTFMHRYNKYELSDPNFPLTKFLIKFKKLFPYVKLIVGGGYSTDYYKKHGFKIFKNYVDTEIVEYTDWCAKKNNTYKFLVPQIEGTEYKEFNQSQILYEENDIIFPDDTLPIEITRGCIFSCKFCSFRLNGKNKNDHIKSQNILFDEFIRNYEKFGVTKYIFSDDTYNDSVDKVKSLYDNVYNKLPFKIQFTTYLRLDLIMRFPETAEYLKESGLVSTAFGIETINHRSAKSMGKGGIDPKVQLEYVRYLKNNEFKNILIGSGFILGLPYDTWDTLEETKEFLLSDKNPLDSFFILALNIQPKNKNISGLEHPQQENFSYLDKNYSEYNYELNDIGQWTNTETNLTYVDCDKIAKFISSEGYKLGKLKSNEFALLDYQSLGIPLEELLTSSLLSITQRYNLEERITNYQKQYISKLLDVINLPKSNLLP